MKFGAIFFFLLTLFLLVSSLGWAQWVQPLIPEGRSQGEPRSLLPKDLNLTDKQIEQMGSTQDQYLRDMTALRNELLNKRYELRRLLSDPKSKASKIRSKQKEVFALESQIQERILDYQLQMRDILTPQQFELWVSKHGMPFGPGMHHGPGMGPMHHGSGMGPMHQGSGKGKKRP